MTVPRRTIRVTRDRIRHGVTLVERSRAGQLVKHNPEARRGCVLEYFAATGKVPPGPCDCRPDQRVREAGGAIGVMRRLTLASTETAAFALPLSILTAENNGTVASWPAMRYRPDSGADGVGVALMEEVKPRRGPELEHRVAALEDLSASLRSVVEGGRSGERLFHSLLRRRANSRRHSRGAGVGQPRYRGRSARPTAPARPRRRAGQPDHHPHPPSHQRSERRQGMSRGSRDRQAERRQLTAAAVRLLNGIPLNSETGRLTVTELLHEAGVCRDVAYGDHKDLLKDFRARARARHRTPAATEALAAENADLKRKLADSGERCHTNARRLRHSGRSSLNSAWNSTPSMKAVVLCDSLSCLHGGARSRTAEPWHGDTQREAGRLGRTPVRRHGNQCLSARYGTKPGLGPRAHSGRTGPQPDPFHRAPPTKSEYCGGARRIVGAPRLPHWLVGETRGKLPTRPSAAPAPATVAARGAGPVTFRHVFECALFPRPMMLVAAAVFALPDTSITDAATVTGTAALRSDMAMRCLRGQTILSVTQRTSGGADTMRNGTGSRTADGGVDP